MIQTPKAMKIPTKQQVLDLITNSPNYYDRTLKREYAEFCAYLRFTYSGKILNESVYKWLHGADSDLCKHCQVKKTKFTGILTGFNSYCSAKCNANSITTKVKREATYSADPDIHKNAVLARQNTMIERYGVAHALQNDDLFNKAKSTFLENYGELGMSHPDIRSKYVETSRKRYGVDSPSMVDAVKEKRAQTNMDKLGVTTPLKLASVIENTTKLRKEKTQQRITTRAKMNGLTPNFNQYTAVSEKHSWTCRTCENTFNAHMDNGSTPTCKICNPGGSQGEQELNQYVRSLIGSESITSNDRAVIYPKELDIYVATHRLALNASR